MEHFRQAALREAVRVPPCPRPALVVLLLAALAVPALAQPSPPIDLGVPAGASGDAYGINDLGQVVGYWAGPAAGSTEHAFLWQGGSIQDLPTLGGKTTRAYAINGSGQVVGVSSTPGWSRRACLWKNGALTVLSSQGADAYASAINSSGDSAGGFYTWMGFHACVWRGGQPTDLTSGQWGQSGATAINDHGVVAGYIIRAGVQRACVWGNGVRRVLGSLDNSDSWALGINNRGQVVGAYRKAASGEIRAILWDGGHMTDLGTLWGAPPYPPTSYAQNSEARAINGDGEVAGYSSKPIGAFYPFTWQEGSGLFELPNEPALGGWANAINGLGDVVGWSGLNRPCAWDRSAPEIREITPEPAVLWPPNHRMVDVTVAVVSHDGFDPSPVSKVVGVTCSEPSGAMDEPDWVITGDLTLSLRAERSGAAQGRTYTITVECQDAWGHTSTGTAQVVVPHDRRK